MKKFFSLLFVTLLTMAVLGGCADGTGESSEDNTSTESGTSSEGSSSQESPEEESSAQENTGEGEQENPSEESGSIVVGIQQDIDSLDPHKATAAGTKEILFNIFEGLVKPDENGGLICAVASDYSISEDGLVYTFTLRENVKFHKDRKSVV